MDKPEAVHDRIISRGAKKRLPNTPDMLYNTIAYWVHMPDTQITALAPVNAKMCSRSFEYLCFR